MCGSEIMHSFWRLQFILTGCTTWWLRAWIISAVYARWWSFRISSPTRRAMKGAFG